MVDPIVTKNWRDLIKPRGLTVDQESLSNTYGNFSLPSHHASYGQSLAKPE